MIVTAPLTATLAGRMYGFTHVGLLSGFITTIHHFGGGFWAYMGGLIFDRTGSYRLIFIQIKNAGDRSLAVVDDLTVFYTQGD